MPPSAASEFRELITRFLNREISAVEFEASFLQRFISEGRPMSENVFVALDELFGDVDCFCANEQLRGEGDLDEAALRASCERTLNVVSSPFNAW